MFARCSSFKRVAGEGVRGFENKQSSNLFIRIAFETTRHFAHTAPQTPPKRGPLSPGTILENRNVQIFRHIPDLREYRRSILLRRKTVGFVPTLGALHAGHLSLIEKAASQNDEVFVSIYLNPTQFGVNEDLDSYPKTFESDMAKLEELDMGFKVQGKGRITTVFAPTTEEMYPGLPPSSEIDGLGSFVSITPLGNKLEGASRPVFFRGVATVCMKLFNIVEPERVYFGQKDIQQCAVIRRMVKDFHLNTDVKVVPIERDADGLALSSRNVYLGARRRAIANTLRMAINKAKSSYVSDRKSSRDAILGPGLEVLDEILSQQKQLAPHERALFELDYLSLADVDSMEEVQEVDESRGAVISGAMKMLPVEDLKPGEDRGEFGGALTPVRLIDNTILEPRSSLFI